MNKQSNIKHVSVGALIFAFSFFPAMALAHDGEGSRATLPVNISTHIDTGDQNDNSDNNTQGDEASSTKHEKDVEHRSINSGRESDENDNSDESDNEIEIDHGSAESATSTIDAPEHVSSHGELRSFLNHIVKEDDRIFDVHVSSTTIETHYEMPARFLWVIPTNLTADVSVNSDGSVTVTYPWYAFLFAKHDSDLAAQLEQSMATSITASTTLSASMQAHLLNLIFSILKGSSE